jgi:uncharacterized protein YndB with AHSA1/START domain
MILRVLIFVASSIALVLIFAATKPKTFRIERSIIIDGPPDRVFALIDNLGNWPRWTPQDREDPSMTRTYSGPANGKGAVSNWTGSGSSGRGAMLITESAPPKKVCVQVDWVKPFVARNVNEFVLESTGTSLCSLAKWSRNSPRTSGISEPVQKSDSILGDDEEAEVLNRTNRTRQESSGTLASATRVLGRERVYQWRTRPTSTCTKSELR